MQLRMLAIAAVILFFTPAFGQGPQHQCRMGMSGGMSGASTMTKRAEIRVIPLAQANDDRVAVEKMSSLLSQMRENRKAVKSTDAATQKQLQLESELADLLESHVKRISSDEGKSETALSVQKKLNAMEGKMMCGACHGMGGQMQMGQ
jgi:hypothetical protein